MVFCPNCGMSIPVAGSVCPYCKADKSSLNGPAAVIAGAFGIILIPAVIGGVVAGEIGRNCGVAVGVACLLVLWVRGQSKDRDSKSRPQVPRSAQRMKAITQSFTKGAEKDGTLNDIFGKIVMPTPEGIRGKDISQIANEVTQHLNRYELAQWLIHGGWSFLARPEYFNNLDLAGKLEIQRLSKMKSNPEALQTYFTNQMSDEGNPPLFDESE